MVSTFIAPRVKHAITFSLSLRRMRVPAVAKALRSFSSKERTRWALLVGIAYNGFNSCASTSSSQYKDDSLAQTHKDVAMFKQFLIEHFSFSADRIVVMTDDHKTPANLWPTKANIEREMTKLRSHALPGNSLVFLYAGHGQQVAASDDTSELDGLDEAIVAMDDTPLIDNDIYRLLVQDIPPNVKLTMLFDCCHSQSMADLKHNLCNKLVDFWPQLRIFFLLVSHFIVKFKGTKGNRFSGPAKRLAAVIRGSIRLKRLNTEPSAIQSKAAQTSRVCDGHCPRIKAKKQDVTSLSAYRDEQTAMEYESRTLTQAVIKHFREHAASEGSISTYPSHRQTLRALSTNAEELLDMWHEACHRSYCRRDSKRTSSSLEHSRPCSAVFRKRVGWQPQFSSQEPLEMEEPFSLTLRL